MSHVTEWGYSKKLFNVIDAQSFFSRFYDEMKTEVEQISDSEIVSCNFDEWANYFSTKYFVMPISIFETNIDRKLTETKVKKENPFRGAPYQEDFLEVDGLRITYKVPFDGEPKLFEVRPSQYILSSFYTRNFVAPYRENYGSFTIDFEYLKRDLQEKGDAAREYVQKQFENEFDSYKKMISYVNNEVNAYNTNLRSSVMRLLKERKEKADSLFSISAALQIPLTVSKNAPNTKPIELKRIVRQPPSKPKVVPEVPEYCISDGDYENINNIVWLYSTTAEKTARTYYANNEEELRDHLLAALNTHYQDVTGETFRKLGKTDILIEFDNKAAFIGECKIWHGEKLFQEAIQQVINYSTWRDVKVSVIIFNKENKSFPSILAQITHWADTSAVSYTQSQANIWKCKYHRQDMNVDIQLTILAFDLYVNKSQFKDDRYKDK